MENSLLKSPASHPSPISLRVSLSLKLAHTKNLERFFSARIRFETPDAERTEFYRVFQRFDTDGDGRLSIKEIRTSLEKLGILITAADLTALLSSDHSDDDARDVDDGYMDFTDFYNMYKSLCQEENEEGGIYTPNGKLHDSDLRSAFDLFDKNHDNFISAEELQAVLISLGFKEANSIDECKSMIDKVDIDRDGMVNFDEFRTMMRTTEEDD